RSKGQAPVKRCAVAFREDAHVCQPPGTVFGRDRSNRRSTWQLPTSIHTFVAHQRSIQSGPRSQQRKMSINEFDAIIIGAGQAGPSLAGKLSGARMTVAFVERNLFGGTCVNTGCMPTKALVASAYAAHLARRAADFGIVLPGAVQIDMRKVKGRVNAIV